MEAGAINISGRKADDYIWVYIPSESSNGEDSWLLKMLENPNDFLSKEVNLGGDLFDVDKEVFIIFQYGHTLKSEVPFFDRLLKNNAKWSVDEQYLVQGEIGTNTIRVFCPTYPFVSKRNKGISDFISIKDDKVTLTLSEYKDIAYIHFESLSIDSSVYGPGGVIRKEEKTCYAYFERLIRNPQLLAKSIESKIVQGLKRLNDEEKTDRKLEIFMISRDGAEKEIEDDQYRDIFNNIKDIRVDLPFVGTIGANISSERFHKSGVFRRLESSFEFVYHSFPRRENVDLPMFSANIIPGECNKLTARYIMIGGVMYLVLQSGELAPWTPGNPRPPAS
jgi:hypothetical protein